MSVVMKPSLVFSYRGTLKDTAALVGLRNVKAPVSQIIYAGEKSFEARRYLVILNRWLSAQGFPQVSSSDSQKMIEALRVSPESILSAWSWGDAECSLAIRLAGLPLPPSTSSEHCA